MALLALTWFTIAPVHAHNVDDGLAPGVNGQVNGLDLHTQSSASAVPASLLGEGVQQIVSGTSHSCALTTAGAVHCWGSNDYGQLGSTTHSGTYNPTPTPQPVTGLASGVTALAAGWEHTCARTTAGAVHCWGRNGRGQLGNGSTASRNTPVAVAQSQYLSFAPGIPSASAALPTWQLGSSLALSATSSVAGGSPAIGYSVWTPNTCTVNGSTLSATPTARAGQLCGVTAARAAGTNGANGSTAAAPSQSSLLLLTTATPTVTLSSSANPSTLGATVTLTATLANAVSPTGTVTFSSASRDLCTVAVLNSAAICSTTELAMGSHSITATYSGDANHTSATSAAITQVVSGYHQSPLPLPTPAGGSSPGNVQVTITGPAGCTAANAAFSASVPAGAPAGSSAPLGVFSFAATSSTPHACDGATLTVTLTYPPGRLAGLQPYKFGPASTGAANSWFRHGSISGDTVTYTVTDNGVGDSDLTLGTIADPFAPLALAAAGAVAIPTLSEWAMLLLAMLVLGGAAWQLRRPASARR